MKNEINELIQSLLKTNMGILFMFVEFEISKKRKLYVNYEIGINRDETPENLCVASQPNYIKISKFKKKSRH